MLPSPLFILHASLSSTPRTQVPSPHCVFVFVLDMLSHLETAFNDSTQQASEFLKKGSRCLWLLDQLGDDGGGGDDVDAEQEDEDEDFVSSKVSLGCSVVGVAVRLLLIVVAFTIICPCTRMTLVMPHHHLQPPIQALLATWCRCARDRLWRTVYAYPWFCALSWVC